MAVSVEDVIGQAEEAITRPGGHLAYDVGVAPAHVKIGTLDVPPGEIDELSAAFRMRACTNPAERLAQKVVTTAASRFHMLETRSSNQTGETLAMHL